MVEPIACNCHTEQSEDDLLLQLDEIIETHKEKPDCLIPILQITQKLFGYLPDKAIRKIAKSLDKSYSEVAGVVGFYSFFSTVPRGKFMVRVCLGTACYVRGGKEVLAALEQSLGIEVGKTTEDRLFSLEVGRCFGACGLAPVVMVNDDVHQRVKAAKVSQILDMYRSAEETSEEKEEAK